MSALPGPSQRSATAPAARQSERRLTVLDARQLADRRRLRRARALFAASALVLTGALAVVVLSQGLVASRQLRLDGAESALSSAITTEQTLQLARAQLEAPPRVLHVAETQLHMVAPAAVTYLAPVSTGPTLGSTTGHHPARRGSTH